MKNYKTSVSHIAMTNFMKGFHSSKEDNKKLVIKRNVYNKIPCVKMAKFKKPVCKEYTS